MFGLMKRAESVSVRVSHMPLFEFGDLGISLCKLEYSVSSPQIALEANLEKFNCAECHKLLNEMVESNRPKETDESFFEIGRKIKVEE